MIDSGIFALNRFDSKTLGSVAVTDAYAPPAADRLKLAFAQSRAVRPAEIDDLAAGLTDLRFYRVSVELGAIGLRLSR